MKVGVIVGSRFRGKVPERQPVGDSSVAKVRMRGNVSVAAEGGKESGGRFKRGRKGKLQPGDRGESEGSGEVGGQSEAGQLSGEDG